MRSSAIKILYWVFIILFAAFLTMDAIGGITKQQAGVDVMQHLGYPVYLMQITGVAKLLGVIAILQPKFNTIKEWAFAGFAFNFIGAFSSRAIVGDSGFLLIFPLIMLAFMFVPYLLWKKLNATASSAPVAGKTAFA